MDNPNDYAFRVLTAKGHTHGWYRSLELAWRAWRVLDGARVEARGSVGKWNQVDVEGMERA